MKRLSIPGLVVAALYIAGATIIVLQDRASPRGFVHGFASFLVVMPYAHAAIGLGLHFSTDNNSQMIPAVLSCAVPFYFLGLLLAKALQFLRNVL